MLHLTTELKGQPGSPNCQTPIQTIHIWTEVHILGKKVIFKSILGAYFTFKYGLRKTWVILLAYWEPVP